MCDSIGEYQLSNSSIPNRMFQFKRSMHISRMYIDTFHYKYMGRFFFHLLIWLKRFTVRTGYDWEGETRLLLKDPALAAWCSWDLNSWPNDLLTKTSATEAPLRCSCLCACLSWKCNGIFGKPTGKDLLSIHHTFYTYILLKQINKKTFTSSRPPENVSFGNQVVNLWTI